MATSCARPRAPPIVMLDTPAGLHGKRLDEVMKLADKVLIPLQPSIFDIHATHDFINQLLAHRRSDSVQLAVVGMRTREGTISTDQLRSFPRQRCDVPLLGLSARHAELRPPRRPRADALGRRLDPLRARPRAMGADHHLGELRRDLDANFANSPSCSRWSAQHIADERLDRR